MTVAADPNDDIKWIDVLPVHRFTAREFRELPEYSCTNPTGTTPGKRWKRKVGAFAHAWKASGGKPRWVVCEYDPNCPPDAKTIAIITVRPIIVVRARTEWAYLG